jgi:hypothetical protein
MLGPTIKTKREELTGLACFGNFFQYMYYCHQIMDRMNMEVVERNRLEDNITLHCKYIGGGDPTGSE